VDAGCLAHKAEVLVDMIYGTRLRVFRAHKALKNICLLNRVLNIAVQCNFKSSGVGKRFPSKENSHALIILNLFQRFLLLKALQTKQV
jgi:hypothetical protein